MKFKSVCKLYLIVAIFVVGMSAGCTNSSNSQENAAGENPEARSGTLAVVDGVTVEQREDHYYAVINGNYPDPCTYISSVDQVVDGNTISITLYTESPADLMCAAVLTPFTIDILLTTGGLMPQEYDVVVNEGPSTTFSLG